MTEAEISPILGFEAVGSICFEKRYAPIPGGFNNSVNSDHEEQMLGHFVSTKALATRTGISRATAWRVCFQNPGFAVREGGTYRIPESHVQRVERGELPAAIAADASARPVAE